MTFITYQTPFTSSYTGVINFKNGPFFGPETTEVIIGHHSKALTIKPLHCSFYIHPRGFIIASPY